MAFAAGREQSALIGSVLLLVGLGLPAVYVGTYLSQLNAQAKKLRLDPPRPVYTLRLAQEGVTIQNDMKAEATVSLEWKNIHAAWRDKGCIYLYATPARAFLLPDGQAVTYADGRKQPLPDLLSGLSLSEFLRSRFRRT